MAKVWYILLFFSLFSFCLCEDLYEVLGIARTADKNEIKRSYAKLAKKWHPDKNRSPEAAEMMAKINKAYKILHNDNKRRRYDLLGEETEDETFKPSKADTRNLLSPTDTISSIQFIDHLVPHSHVHPYLIYYFHDFCQPCLDWTEKWEELRENFVKLGLGTASVHVIISTQATLFSRIPLNKVPKIGLLVKGVVHHYNGGLITLDSVKEFVEPLIPSLIKEVTAVSQYNANISRIYDNKPLVLLVSTRATPSLSYKLLALGLNKFANFLFLSSSNSPPDVLNAWSVKENSKKLLIYKEPVEPDVVLESFDSSHNVKTTVHTNKLLLLPRISSQLIFDSICPYGAHRRTCLILVTQGSSQYTDELTDSFRRLAIKWRQEDVGVAYIDTYRQRVFSDKFYSSIEANQKDCSNGYTSRSVLLLHRMKLHESYYTWHHGYCGHNKNEESLRKLSKLKDKLLGKLIHLDPMEDESVTWWSHIYESLPRYWEKLLSIFFLPLPLLILSCYLYCSKDTQQGGQRVERTGPLARMRRRVAEERRGREREPLQERTQRRVIEREEERREVTETELDDNVNTSELRKRKRKRRQEETHHLDTLAVNHTVKEEEQQHDDIDDDNDQYNDDQYNDDQDDDDHVCPADQRDNKNDNMQASKQNIS